MTRTRDRVIIWVIAILFICTSVGIGASAIWQMTKDSKARKDATASASQPVTKEGTKMQDFTPVAKVDELQKIDTQVGTGAEVQPGATITFDYTGALASTGVIFDSGENVTYPLTGLIQGWQAGIPGMKEGGKRRLLIPAAQGYGAADQPGIPANSDLVFDITVHKIGK